MAAGAERGRAYGRGLQRPSGLEPVLPSRNGLTPDHGSPGQAKKKKSPVFCLRLCLCAKPLALSLLALFFPRDSNRGESRGACCVLVALVRIGCERAHTSRLEKPPSRGQCLLSFYDF